jgi:hypothetical protein
MDTQQPTMTGLFQQLGLPHEPGEIATFIRRHKPLAEDVKLADAPFWSPAQATFLHEKIKADDHWAVVIDALSASLRQHGDFTQH